jgi:fumarate hydratase subunit beta
MSFSLSAFLNNPIIQSWKSDTTAKNGERWPCLQARVNVSNSLVQAKRIETPVVDEVISELQVGNQIEIFGKIFTGRDAILPIIRGWIEQGQIDKLNVDLRGSVIMHAGFSVAGFGPTTSNKAAIEGSIPALAAAGVKIHLGKGALSPSTAKALEQHHSIFAVIPPVTALLMQKMKSKRVVAFQDEGMEAMHELTVEGLPAIVAIAHGDTMFKNRGQTT